MYDLDSYPLVDVHPGWTYYEQAELNGIKYDIFVAHYDSRYLGAWSCVKCGANGSTTTSYSASDDASVQAQINLCTHHARFHRYDGWPASDNLAAPFEA
jgi:hypothetical protein